MTRESPSFSAGSHGPVNAAQPLRLLDLFSGIGGFSLGLERSGGFRTVAFCEIEPFCRRVLAKHWPGVPQYDDVRTLTAGRLAADGITVDAICGGFPCQDISFAGKGAGLAGERSGLWREYSRLIGEIRPRYVIVENVAALLGRGLGDVLGDLAALGYDAEWHCIPASAVGAPHRRDRLWIVAHSVRIPGQPCRPGDAEQGARGWDVGGGCVLEDVADTKGERRGEARRFRRGEPAQRAAGGGEVGGYVPNPYGEGLQVSWTQQIGAHWQQGGGLPSASDWWRVEPDVGRVAHGVPQRVDRLRGLGNAVVPQIPELIGRAIMAAEARA